MKKERIFKLLLILILNSNTALAMFPTPFMHKHSLRTGCGGSSLLDQTSSYEYEEGLAQRAMYRSLLSWGRHDTAVNGYIEHLLSTEGPAVAEVAEQAVEFTCKALVPYVRAAVEGAKASAIVVLHPYSERNIQKVVRTIRNAVVAFV